MTELNMQRGNALSTSPHNQPPALEACDVSMAYQTRGGYGKKTVRRAVDEASIEVREGEIVALVGETGCGKSTLSRLLLGLLRPSNGIVKYRGTSLVGMSKAATRAYRSEVQVIFQDPSASLNPRQRVWQAMASVLRVHGVIGEAERDKAAFELLASVGLNPPHAFANRFPHELSGGQQQRVAIARAFATQPRLIIADEPLSALDVSIQAQILDLMMEHQRRTNAGYLIVTHDLNVVHAVAGRVVVMYLGRVVESGTAAGVFDDPRHPYTQALLASRLGIDPTVSRIRDRPTLPGDVPTSTAIPTGCPFHPRCPIAQPICATERPSLLPRGGVSLVACHFADR